MPSKTGKKGKKPHKNHPTSKKYTKYKIVGDKVTIIGKHQQYPSYWKVRTVER